VQLNHTPPAERGLWWAPAPLHCPATTAPSLVEYFFDLPSFQNRYRILFWNINYFIEYKDGSKILRKERLLKLILFYLLS